MKKKLPKISTLANKTWGLMSEYSRRKDANSDGFTKCVTCVVVKHWKEMHAGHFFHGSKQRPISYDDRNIHSQCTSCNTYKGGCRDEYAVYVKNRYGPETLDELQAIKHQGKEMKRADLEEMIAILEVRLEHI